MVHLDYGGADSCIALATGSIRSLLDWLEVDGKPDVGHHE
jgi:predicted GH43/DUF377 family glycosyl hydrolase